MKRIEMGIWKPKAEDPRYVERVGQRSGLEVFRELKRSGAGVLISTHMLDSVEDYWDVAHIMVNGAFAATKVNEPGAEGDKSLEELFFSITEGEKA